jgi:C-terminal processing protease CtpA/Prc
MDNKLNIVKKVIKVIKKNGIKKYIDNFDFKFDFNKEDNDDIFYNKLNIFVKKYHHHTSLIQTRKINNAFDNNDDKNIIRWKSSKTWRKLPDFELKNNIGIIKFYSFIRMQGKDSDLINNKDRDKIVEVMTNRLDDWLNNKKIKGLIIDFSKHHGGDFKPVAFCFGKYFDTLFRFYEDNTSSLWLTIVKDKLVEIKYKSNKNYFPIPIAVIIGKNTSSSGEFSAGIFYNKPNIKFFGEQTHGDLSANSGIKINKYLELNLTVALFQSADKKIHYDEKLYPDVETKNPTKDAIKWINNFKK